MKMSDWFLSTVSKQRCSVRILKQDSGEPIEVYTPYIPC